MTSRYSLLDYLGLGDRARNLPEALSGGQQQRAGVVVVTHDHRSLDVFDRILEMEDGELRVRPA